MEQEPRVCRVVDELSYKKRKRTVVKEELMDRIFHKGEQMEKVLEEWTEKELEEDVHVKFVYKVERLRDGPLRLSNCEVFVNGDETNKVIRHYWM